MKIITISQIGYNHPSQANWSYYIFKIDTIDTTKQYNISYTVKANFVSDTQIQRLYEEKTNIPVLITKSVYTGTGTPKITGINKILDYDNKEIINNLIEFNQ